MRTSVILNATAQMQNSVRAKPSRGDVRDDFPVIILSAHRWKLIDSAVP